MARKAKKKTKAAKKVNAEIIENNLRGAPVKAEVMESESRSIAPGKLPALNDGLSSYLQTIQKYPLLTREEEAKIAAADLAAAKKLVADAEAAAKAAK